MKHLELFEKFLFRSRILITLSLLVNLMLGLYLIIISTREFINLSFNLFSLKIQEIIVEILTIVDLILLAIVMFIFSFSLYEIFIKKIDPNNSIFKKIPEALIIKSLDGLKDKLGKVILIVLIITFFKFTINYNFETIEELTMFSISIFFISLSLFFSKNPKKRIK